MINSLTYSFVPSIMFYEPLCAKPTWSAGDYTCDCDLGSGSLELGMYTLSERHMYKQLFNHKLD